jgi:hypothetical protein
LESRRREDAIIAAGSINHDAVAVAVGVFVFIFILVAPLDFRLRKHCH